MRLASILAHHMRGACARGVLFRFLLSKDVYVVLRTQRDQLKSVKCVVIYVRRSVYLGISPKLRII